RPPPALPTRRSSDLERGHVAGLRFNNRQRSQRTGLALDLAVGEALDPLLVYARGALEQAGVQIEHVTGIGFAARRAAQQQRHLTIGPGLLGQVVVNDESVLTAVAEVFAHRAARVRRDVLHRGGFGGGSGHDDGVFHRAVLFQLAHHVGDGRGFLTDRDVDTSEVLALLVDDRVDRDGGLTRLTVADDQFALAAADRHHRVHRLQTGLYRLRHGLPPDHARCDFLDDVGFGGIDGALAVDRLAERVDH